ncbi:MAG: urease accessory protein UreD [Aquabacterium sp.]|uniref:urease accessory protein UreD n=1 Tax=Aquabacterium sp. TaxID=1872578 RepID=UPI0025C245C4|nr:urease accessory protein UreD [Aquabacterium sp.]MBI5925790.1 urease accessory protein UreD [Aquabacterium sp.]
MSWHGHLNLDYRLDGERTIALDRHDGPLRVLQRLYPEGDRVCHHVLVHPPGGLVGGDVLDIAMNLQSGSHALITTPGATRFYKSTGAEAVQTLTARVAPGARLEWLPLETLAYRSCLATNRMRFELAPGAEMMGWDVLALGLPAASEAFDDAAHGQGRFTQEIELPGVWLEKGTVHADDARLLDSPLGWAGHRVMATMWLASGAPLSRERREALLDSARAIQGNSPLAATAGSTSPHEQVVILRVLADRVEPAMNLLTQVWAQWRQTAWDLAPCPPRVWRT